MKRLLILGAIGGLVVTLASVSMAATTVKSSKSNTSDRVMVYSTKVVSEAQVAAILAELDKQGAKVVDEATLRGILKKHGVPTDRITRVVIEPSKRGRKDGTIILLDNPADEAHARQIAVSDSGVVAPKPVPKGGPTTSK